MLSVCWVLTLQEQQERFTVTTVVFAQYPFCLIPKILNAVNVVLPVSKLFAVINPVIVKTTDIPHVVITQPVRINYACQA